MYGLGSECGAVGDGGKLETAGSSGTERKGRRRASESEEYVIEECMRAYGITDTRHASDVWGTMMKWRGDPQREGGIPAVCEYGAHLEVSGSTLFFNEIFWGFGGKARRWKRGL